MSKATKKMMDPNDPSSRQDRMARRQDLRCSMCPPHKQENSKNIKRNVQKPKSKNHRRKK